MELKNSFCIKKIYELLIYTILSIFFISLTSDISIINFNNTNWLMREDFSPAFLGLQFYNLNNFSLPIGTNELYGKSTILYSGSVPIVAIIYKLLNPQKIYNPYGLYLLIVYILQCHSFLLLIKRIRLKYYSINTDQIHEIILISAFSLLTPIFIANISNNFNLQPHFLFIYVLGFSIIKSKSDINNIYIICLISLFFDAYIALINLICYVGIALLNIKLSKINYYKNILFIVIYCTFLYQIGYIGNNNNSIPADCCWGRYGINILGWLDARGQEQNFTWSRLFGDIPGNNGWEVGFNFIGSILIISILSNKNQFIKLINEFKKEYYLYLLALLAITNYINVGAISFKVPLFNTYIENNLLSIFRGSGRFIWPINYIISAIAVIIIIDHIKNISQYKKYIIIISLVSFQIFDAWSAIYHIKSRFSNKEILYSQTMIEDCIKFNCKFIGFDSPQNHKKKYEIIAYTALKSSVETNAVYLARYDSIKYKNDISNIINKNCIKDDYETKKHTAIIAFDKKDLNKFYIQGCSLFNYENLSEYSFAVFEIE